MEPVNNYQNGLVHSSASEQTQNQVTIHVLDGAAHSTVTTTTSNLTVADPVQVQRIHQLGILTHDVCHKILEFLNCDMALALTCKHFASNREKMSVLLKYEKLCASEAPPQCDPFRGPIREKTPSRISQQDLWKRLWLAREAGNEPWDFHYQGDLSFASPCIKNFFNAILENEKNRQEPIIWPGRRFEVCIAGPNDGFEDYGCSFKKQFSILNIYEGNRKISYIQVSTGILENPSPLFWGASSENGIIGLIVKNGFYVWKPNLDRLLASK